ncbi:M1 family metallopeptidase [Moheibacter stercoris]|uniref:Aminopeptidase N n=1 Tax=Moheibacter stercoris TaxID=1628251 RepID=A0ABV2LX00_9FLAO
MRLFFLAMLFLCLPAKSQVLNHKTLFTKQDSLRGSNNDFRNWWNVLHYDISIEADFDQKFIKGKNILKFEVEKNVSKQILQIDLQEPMKITSALLNGKKLKNMVREGNVYFLTFNEKLQKNKSYQLEMKFEGNPRVAKNAPWDGGWIFKKDKNGNPWMSVACQGLGASVWFPNKDYLGDEPDKGARLTMIVPKNMMGIAMGNLKKVVHSENSDSYTWEVVNPINNYNIIPYIGKYAEIKDSYQGEKGNLPLSYWVLDYNVEAATHQFQQTKPMLKHFEHWFGPYPFYEDGFKLVESPHLGMEHQSAIAYGNHFENGYLGRDLSGSGWGLKWDFILIHESGHEWFGNNITNKDVADMWIHESFTAYSETLHTQELFGVEAGNDYVIGTRVNILNDIPMIGHYGVNQEGSGDIYYKGANMIHTFRQLLEDDELFRQILREMNSTFYHKTVTTKEIEDFMSVKSKIDLTEFFHQYLRTTQIPILEYSITGNELMYRWTNVVDGFDMPLKIAKTNKWIYPTQQWKTEKLDSETGKNFKIDRNFYIQTKNIH